jgi:hypothetical protein
MQAHLAAVSWRPENRIRQQQIQAIEISTKGGFLGKRNDHAEAAFLNCEKRFMRQLLAVFLP